MTAQMTPAHRAKLIKSEMRRVCEVGELARITGLNPVPTPAFYVMHIHPPLPSEAVVWAQMTTEVLFIIARFPALAVWVDARGSGCRHGGLWALAVLCAWVVALPLYLWTRFSGQQRGGHY